MLTFRLPTNLAPAAGGMHLLYGALQEPAISAFPVPAHATTAPSRWSRACWSCWASASKPRRGIASGLEAPASWSPTTSPFVDIFLINALLPSAFVAKSDVAGWPLIGWLARRNARCSLSAASRKAAPCAANTCWRRRGRRRRLAIFPKARRRAGDRVLPFHGALFQAPSTPGRRYTRSPSSYIDARRPALPSQRPISATSASWSACARFLASGGLVGRLRLAASFAPPFAGPPPRCPSLPTRQWPLSCVSDRRIRCPCNLSVTQRQSARNARSKMLANPRVKKGETPCKAT
jgi:hypothetical protein